MNKSIKIAIAGAGTMGVTLSRLFAQYGFNTVLWNRKDSSLKLAESKIKNELKALNKRNRIDEEPDEIINRITFSTNLNEFSDVDYVIENIAENIDIKSSFFNELCKYVSKDTIIASNTSGLLISDIAKTVTEPGRFCGMHFWNPPDLIPLVEVTSGEKTLEETAKKVYNLALALNKKPIMAKKDILGIIGNRLQFAVCREALNILSNGIASPEDIDKAMKYGPGRRYPILGPLESLDFTGLDVADAISSYLYPDLSSENRSPALSEEIEKGRLGIKTGAGFYDYPADTGNKKLRWRNELLIELEDILKNSEFKNI